MEYDLEYLARTHGFNTREMEKVCRIFDVLEDISSVKFLGERLSLYGGTALNFIYFKDIPRLSVDLDFNYRHRDAKDWGEVRDEVDERIKQILYMRGYKKSDLNINPSYPLCRMDVSYQSSLGIRDGFVIEVGYMRRYSILKSDVIADFMHMGKGERFKILTPTLEELFANKFGVCLYRTTSRDIYDVYRIAEMKFDVNTFRKCVVIDSLMRGKPALTEINVSDTIGKVSLDTSLKNLLRTEEADRVNFQNIKQQVIKFSENVLENLHEKDIMLIREFYEKKQFRPEVIDGKSQFHDKLREHPAILRALETL